MNKKLSFMALSLTALLSLGACSDDKPKTTGEKVDEAISKTKDVAKDLAKKPKMWVNRLKRLLLMLPKKLKK